MDHNSQEVLFDSDDKINAPHVAVDRIKKINAIEIRQQHDKTLRFDGVSPNPHDGIDFDDITVTGECNRTPEGNCTDMLDNDNDGKTDCKDSDCAGNIVACPPVGVRFFRGDGDDNGNLELTDAVRVLGFLFLGNAPPAPPGPPGPGNSCGVDPTPNDAAVDLGCLSYTKC